MQDFVPAESIYYLSVIVKCFFYLEPSIFFTIITILSYFQYHMCFGKLTKGHGFYFLQNRIILFGLEMTVENA